jgi:hypothetical protein
MFGKAFAFVFIALLLGLFAARVADTSAAISAAPVSAPELPSNSRSVTLSRGNGGHTPTTRWA